MVHIFAKKKHTMWKLSKIGELYGWMRIDWGKENVTFKRGDSSLTLVKIDGGYKVMLSKNDKPVNSDVLNSKENAIALAGESLAYYQW